MWANAPLRPARASTARQHRERPRPTPLLSLGGRCLPFDRVWPSPISSSAAFQTYAVRRHTAQSWYQSALSLRRHPALAMGARHRSSTCTTTCRPSSARTAPAALAAADPDSRSSPSSRRPAAAPTRRSTASASPRPRRARRRAPRHRSVQTASRGLSRPTRCGTGWRSPAR